MTMKRRTASTSSRFREAQDKGRLLARGGDGGDGRPATVAEAIDAYALNLAARGGEAANVGRVRFHLPATLAAKTVSLLTVPVLRQWRDGLLRKGLRPASVNRTCKPLIAALTAAADADPKSLIAQLGKFVPRRSSRC